LGYIDGKCYHIWHTWILWVSVADFWCANIPVVLYEIARLASPSCEWQLRSGVGFSTPAFFGTDIMDQIYWTIGPQKLASQG